MNLVAYVSQSIEEVLTDRKEQDHALRQFDQTLEKQGVRLSAIPEDRLASSAAKRILAYEAPDPEVLRARRTAHLQKLQALRAKSLSSDAAPSVVAGSTQLKHVKIKELFPREGTTPEPEDQPDETLPGDVLDIPVSDEFSDESIPDAGSLETESLPVSITQNQQDFLEEDADASAGMETAEIQTGITEPEEAAPEESEAVDPEAVEAGATETADSVEESLSKEELIEQRIRQFEEELAMPCPICSTGKVLSDTTEKGKTYFHCSNEDCRLISWGKPFHMECPICKNPFLIEVPEPDGQIGLKCPRATCLYRKMGADDIVSNEKSAPGKRKVAVVKKKRKKGVRRVVRRKS